MGVLDDARAELATVRVFSFTTQCAGKFAWLSRALAENAARLLSWSHPDDDRPITAYPCPHCSTTAFVIWHIGHQHKGPSVEKEPLIDPDCKAGKCATCVGGPCEHECHDENGDR